MPSYPRFSKAQNDSISCHATDVLTYVVVNRFMVLKTVVRLVLVGVYLSTPFNMAPYEMLKSGRCGLGYCDGGHTADLPVLYSHHGSLFGLFFLSTCLFFSRPPT